MIKLDEPVSAAPLQRVNFFNGRVLTAEDLRAEREAVRRMQARLGHAVGEGVVEGLWVERTASDGVLSITPGLAVSRDGGVLELSDRVELVVGQQIDPRQLGPGVFRVCGQAQGSVILSAPGVYLLTVEPTSKLSVEQAPKSGLGVDGRSYGCEARWVVESVLFRMRRIDLEVDLVPELGAPLVARLRALETSTDDGARELRRNLLAHLFLGTLGRRAAPEGLFRTTDGRSAWRRYGVLDRLREQGLLPTCAVPLGLVAWLGSTFDFVDPWAVRRRLVPAERSRDWPVPGDDRGAREREAAFLQFGDHFRDLAVRGVDLRTVRARNYFQYLPAVGVLPVAQGARAGIDPAWFWDGLYTRRQPQYLDAAELDGLVARGFDMEPTDLGEGVMMWVAQVWQTARAADQGQPVDRTVVFASPHLAEPGIARCDVARWNYSNYAR